MEKELIIVTFIDRTLILREELGITFDPETLSQNNIVQQEESNPITLTYFNMVEVIQNYATIIVQVLMHLVYFYTGKMTSGGK